MCRPPNWDGARREIEAREGMKAEGQVVRELAACTCWEPSGTRLAAFDLQLRGAAAGQVIPAAAASTFRSKTNLMRIFADPWVRTILEIARQ